MGEHNDGANHVRFDAGPHHDKPSAEQDTEETPHSQGKVTLILLAQGLRPRIQVSSVAKLLVRAVERC